jgi:Arc/MetJ-type ribon-helix-helix transcriptional regulator
MNIELSGNLEKFVHDAVRSGLYAREEDVVRDALTRLQKMMPLGCEAPKTAARPRGSTEKKVKTPLTPDELDHYLISLGLITRLPDPSEDIEDDLDDEPVVIEGEPLSEAIIRERR